MVANRISHYLQSRIPAARLQFSTHVPVRELVSVPNPRIVKILRISRAFVLVGAGGEERRFEPLALDIVGRLDIVDHVHTPLNR
jgi:hypothetical protein